MFRLWSGAADAVALAGVAVALAEVECAVMEVLSKTLVVFCFGGLAGNSTRDSGVWYGDMDGMRSVSEMETGMTGGGAVAL